jgi:hypothetical protein
MEFFLRKVEKNKIGGEKICERNYLKVFFCLKNEFFFITTNPAERQPPSRSIGATTLNRMTFSITTLTEVRHCIA